MSRVESVGTAMKEQYLGSPVENGKTPLLSRVGVLSPDWRAQSTMRAHSLELSVRGMHSVVDGHEGCFISDPFCLSQAQAGWLQHDFGHLSVFSKSKWNHVVHKFVIGHLKVSVQG